MAQAKKASSNKELKGYALKARRGLVPFPYEKGSRSYEQGAWKNWGPSQQRDLAAANRGEGKFAFNEGRAEAGRF